MRSGGERRGTLARHRKACLVAAAEKTASDKKIACLRVRSNIIRDRAHGFYERLGFANVKHPKFSRRRYNHKSESTCSQPIAPDLSSSYRYSPLRSFPVKTRDRLAVTSWPFRTLIDSPTNRQRDATVPGIDLKEFPALIVEKFGVHNINPLSDHFHSSDPLTSIPFVRRSRKAGSHVVDLGLSGKQFYSSDAAARTEAVEFGRKWIDI